MCAAVSDASDDLVPLLSVVSDMHDRVGRGQRMHEVAPVCPDVHLHPEVPLVARLRLPHLGIARRRRVLRRARGADDRRVDEGARLQQ